MNVRAILLLFVMLSGGCVSVQGQAIASGSEGGGDAALIYHLVHTNTQPAKCGCFDATGAGLSGSLRFSSQLAGVAEAGLDFASNGPGTGNSLTLGSVLVGGRYYGRVYGASLRVQPFAELLLGLARAGGGIAGAGDHTSAFAGHVGGGGDVPLTGRFSLRAEAEYFPTTFANAASNRQNNFLVGAGVVWRWSHP